MTSAARRRIYVCAELWWSARRFVWRSWDASRISHLWSVAAWLQTKPGLTGRQSWARPFLAAVAGLGTAIANLSLYVTGNGRVFFLGTIVWLAVAGLLFKRAFAQRRHETGL